MATAANLTVPLNNKIEADLEKIDSLTAGSLSYYNSIFRQLAVANPQNAHRTHGTAHN